MLFNKYIGFKLGDVKGEIEKSGYCIEKIIVTSPKKYYKYDDNSRIVKINIMENNKIKLFVCVSL